MYVLDPSLLDTTDVTAGLKPGGWVVINIERKPEEIATAGNFRIATVDAGQVAVKHGLGTATAPIVNTAIIGAFAKATGEVSIEAVCAAIMETLPRGGEANAAACKEAYETTLLGEGTK